MDEALIDRWNQVVKEEDTIWHLGDFCLGGENMAWRYLARLRGQIHFVLGGHDRRWASKLEGLTHPIIEASLVTRKFDGVTVTLCHYPLASWEKSHYGAMHFHGHCHGTIGRISPSADMQMPPGEMRGKRIDVGVDCWDFRPVCLGELMRIREGEPR
jgi:calcineurin-like phosphoesterase family protein